jgi:hypothetical protein
MPERLFRARHGLDITLAAEQVALDYGDHCRANGAAVVGHLMHAIIDDALTGTWPFLTDTENFGGLTGARTLPTPRPLPPVRWVHREIPSERPHHGRRSEHQVQPVKRKSV